MALPAPFAQLAASAQQEEHKERQEQLQQQQLQEEDQHQQQPQEQQRRQRRLSARESGDDSELVADQDAAMGLEVVAAVQQLEADKAAARGSQEGWEQLQGVLVAAQQAEHLEATQRLEVALGACLPAPLLGLCSALLCAVPCSASVFSLRCLAGEGQLLQEAQQHASQVRSMAAPLSLMSPVSASSASSRARSVCISSSQFECALPREAAFLHAFLTITLLHPQCRSAAAGP